MSALALNLADGVVAYWQRSSAHWFSKDSGFDERFRERFLSLHLAAASRRCDGWMDDATGALALMILLDQYPRNAFRGTAHMYATDGLALHFARQAEARGYMNAVEAPMRLFFACRSRTQKTRPTRTSRFGSMPAWAARPKRTPSATATSLAASVVFRTAIQS